MATRWRALRQRQRSCADPISLIAVASAAAREPGCGQARAIAPNVGWPEISCDLDSAGGQASLSASERCPQYGVPPAGRAYLLKERIASMAELASASAL